MAAVSEAVAYSRLLRPFSLKRMDGALYHVEASAALINKRKLGLLVDPPTDPALWANELERLQGDLWLLAQQCEEAHTRLELLVRSAPRDYELAIDAMTKIIHGISATTSLAEAA